MQEDAPDSMDPVVSTKKDMGDSMSPTKLTKKERKAEKKKNKKPMTKSDKIAVVAALLTACLVIWGVYAMAWPMVRSIFEGSATEQKTISVPSVTGMEKLEAKLKVEKLNLKFDADKQAYSDDVDKGKIISQDPLAGEKLAKDGTVKVVISKGAKKDEMPDVVNMDRSEAISELEDLGLTVHVSYDEDDNYPDDTVIKQTPEAGSNIKSGDKAVLYVNQIAEATKSTTVPNVIGQTVTEAESALADSSLVLGTKTKQYSDTVDEGNIIRQTITAGTKISKQSKVGVVVSLGPEPQASVKPSASPAASPAASPKASTTPTAATVTKQITVKVPQDKASTLITVKLDDNTVYSETVSKDKGSISINITGKSGETKMVRVYYDGVFAISSPKSF